MMLCQLMLISATFSFATNTFTTTHFGFFFSGEAICSYMFTIVIENIFEPLYCTEKLINAQALHCIVAQNRAFPSSCLGGR